MCWRVWRGIPWGLHTGTTQEAVMKSSQGDITICNWEQAYGAGILPVPHPHGAK